MYNEPKTLLCGIPIYSSGEDDLMDDDDVMDRIDDKMMIFIYCSQKIIQRD